jgi:hypothetical protein
MSEPQCCNSLPTSAEDWSPSAAKQNPNADGRAGGRPGPDDNAKAAPTEPKRRSHCGGCTAQAFLEDGQSLEGQ